MKSLFHAAKFLILDLASTLFFVAVYSVTRDAAVAIILGMSLGLGQIAWQLARKTPVDAMQWVSLMLVLSSGFATLLTHDARFVMIKASVAYAAIGVAMLKRGWMNRYLPQRALELVPDIGTAFGYVWAALMVFTAGLNIVVAMTTDLITWAAFMSAWALGSKIGLFAIQFITMRLIAIRRQRGAGVVMMAAE